MRNALCLCLFALLPALGRAQDPAVFGTTKNGVKVERFELRNAQGTKVDLISLGATVQRWEVMGKDKKPLNIVCGFSDVAGYESDGNQYFGCTTGRVAGRIANGRFSIDGKEYKVAVNNGKHHLHGGVKSSLDKVVWKGAYTKDKAGNPGVRFNYTSPDGDEGYPGNLKMEVLYTLNDKNELRIDYDATTDKATPINLTNHSYFNLAGSGADTVLDHELKVEGNQYVPTDDELIPTGKIESVKGTPVDFTKSTKLGDRIGAFTKGPFKGYDHTFVLSKRGKAPTLAATLRHPASGRVLKVLTNQPALQLYTGNHLKSQKGTDGAIYKQHSAICLETQYIPDAINQPSFPSVVLRPGEAFRFTCIYRVE